MPIQNTIACLLADSFADTGLSNEEKFALGSLLEPLADQEEILAYTRNKAFELVSQHQSTEPKDYVRAVNWLERVVKTIDSVRVATAPKVPTAHFSPGTACIEQIIKCIGSAKETIDVCVFTIADDRIVESLLTAHQKGKEIRILSDNVKADDQGSDIYALAEQGIHVRVDESPAHMHHKFAIIDRSTLINGSFNWTRSASQHNEENITVLHDQNLIMAFSEKFEEIWSASQHI